MRRVILILLSSLMTHSSWAASAGSTSASVLKLGVGARAMAMGEAYTAQADDVSSLYWNPAGLALMQQRQASFMYSQLLRDLTYQNLGLGIPLSNGAFGASLSYLGYGNIKGYDETGVATGDQSAYSAVGTVGAAWLANMGSVGINLKTIQEKLSDEKAQGLAMDIGGTFIYPQPLLGGTLRLGAVYQNLGQGLKFISERDPLPSQVKVGVAMVQLARKKLNLSLDIGKPTDDDLTYQGGAEYWLSSFLALRAGYANTHSEGKGVRAGVGLRIKSVDFDYAFAEFGDLGMTHRYELSFRFGEPRPVLTAEERDILRQAKAALDNGSYDRALLLFNSLVEMEPRYRPAQQYLRVAMGKMEERENQLAKQQGGDSIDPSFAQVRPNANMGDMDDLEQLLGSGEKATAQAVPGTGDKKE